MKPGKVEFEIGYFAWKVLLMAAGAIAPVITLYADESAPMAGLVDVLFRIQTSEKR